MSSAVSPFDRAYTTSCSSAIETVCIYLVPYLCLAPLPLWVNPLEFHRDLWQQKTGVPGLSFGVSCAMISLDVSTEIRRVTD